VDFPVLVRLDPSRIDYAVMAPDGSDLRFVDTDNTTLLDHEIEVWNPGGDSIVWVRVPEIDAASGGDFVWMYYGSPAAADLQNPTGVWLNGYAGVWHLVDGSDSTVHGNDGVINGPVAVAGQVGGALDFDGLDDHVEVPHDPSLAVTGSLMIEAWIRVADSSGENYRRIVSKKLAWTDSNGFNLEYSPRQNLLVNLGSGSNGGQASALDLDPSWHYVVGTISGSTAALYADGVDRTTDNTASPLVAGTTSLRIGDIVTGGASFFGAIDEVRISSTSRTPAWIDAQYRSMSGAMVSFSSEE
jgi:hypothetical protein